MSAKTVLKSIFSIPMLLIYLLVYVFRFPIMIFILTAYTQYFSPGKAFIERLIGEFYFSEAQHFDEKATIHFANSLQLYTQKLDTSNDLNEKGRIETLIGSQYECGKGVTTDLAMAKQWYKTAIEHGNTEAQQALNNLEARILKQKNNPNTGKQCVEPL